MKTICSQVHNFHRGVLNIIICDYIFKHLEYTIQDTSVPYRIIYISKIKSFRINVIRQYFRMLHNICFNLH